MMDVYKSLTQFTVNFLKIEIAALAHCTVNPDTLQSGFCAPFIGIHDHCFFAPSV